MRRRAMISALTTATAVIAYHALLRPWHTRWGATEEEVNGDYPGDEIVPRPNIKVTRAIGIEAPPSAIWPWVVQIGQGRGGFYSYTKLENLFGLEIQNVDRIVPELQGLGVGDVVGLAREGSDWIVVRVEPERDLVLHVETGAVGDVRLRPGDYVNSSWGFYLRGGGGATRLIVRWRGDWRLRPLSMLVAALLEPAHFVMERKMLREIKRHAERGAVA